MAHNLTNILLKTEEALVNFKDIVRQFVLGDELFTKAICFK